MQAIGRNASHITAGALNPTDAVTRPSDAARLYPGAVEATPMTVADTQYLVLAFRDTPAEVQVRKPDFRVPP